MNTPLGQHDTIMHENDKIDMDENKMTKMKFTIQMKLIALMKQFGWSWQHELDWPHGCNWTIYG